jgi:hypothetical protein
MGYNIHFDDIVNIPRQELSKSIVTCVREDEMVVAPSNGQVYLPLDHILTFYEKHIIIGDSALSIIPNKRKIRIDGLWPHANVQDFGSIGIGTIAYKQILDLVESMISDIETYNVNLNAFFSMSIFNFAKRHNFDAGNAWLAPLLYITGIDEPYVLQKQKIMKSYNEMFE